MVKSYELLMCGFFPVTDIDWNDFDIDKSIQMAGFVQSENYSRLSEETPEL